MDEPDRGDDLLEHCGGPQRLVGGPYSWQEARHDGPQIGVEALGAEDGQLVEGLRRGILGLVDEQDRPEQDALDVLAPLVAQGSEPTVGGRSSTGTLAREGSYFRP